MNAHFAILPLILQLSNEVSMSVNKNRKAKYFLELHNQYSKKTQESDNLEFITVLDQLYHETYTALQTADSDWANLSQAELNELQKVFHIFCRSLPQWRDVPKNKQFYYANFYQNNTGILGNSKENCFLINDKKLMSWLLYQHLFASLPAETSLGCLTPIADKLNNGSTAAGIGYFLLGIIISLLTMVAVSYIFKALLDAGERIYYNEDIGQAILSLGSLIAGAVAGSFFGYYIAAVPIILLTMAVGVGNPFTMAILGIVICALIGATVANYITTEAQEFFLADYSKQNPWEPQRFGISNEENDNLIKNAMDVDKAEVVIMHANLLIQQVAAAEGMKKNKIPGLFDRRFSERGAEMQNYLNIVRQVRKGELLVVVLNGHKYNLMREEITPQQLQIWENKNIDAEQARNLLQYIHACIDSRMQLGLELSADETKEYIAFINAIKNGSISYYQVNEQQIFYLDKNMLHDARAENEAIYEPFGSVNSFVQQYGSLVTTAPLQIITEQNYGYYC